ncbi:MAG: NAD-dependent epimerase/dehydratase family protein [Alphaproteobacteria bacterium]|nr:NAD-dependent epimerase/dehydratase family protein [Alphaproteobacteria bacterium]
MRFFVTGGAGFLGSNLVGTILDQDVGTVTVYDNFVTGRRAHFSERSSDPRLTIIEGDVSDLERLKSAVAGHDVVFHLAANADIARAASEPMIDFNNGTVLTQTLLEAMRLTGVKRVLFTSGSGVYGDVPADPIPEDYSHMVPISTYGAQKLASETLVSAYCHMFDFVGTVFRFANVVGPNMTHGVSHDFVLRLRDEPSRLRILGDGQQRKPYIHSSDVIAAMLRLQAQQTEGYNYFNVSSEDSLLVRDIADIVVEEMGLKDVSYEFTGGARGWRADVPIYSLDSSKVRAAGWRNKLSSREAVTAAVRSMISEFSQGKR